jgi:hypothetical protein
LAKAVAGRFGAVTRRGTFAQAADGNSCTQRLDRGRPQAGIVTILP